jgi:hypothetical protein
VSAGLASVAAVGLGWLLALALGMVAHPRPDRLWGAAAIAALLLAVPTLWDQYLLLLVPALAIVWVRSGWAWRRAVVVWIVAANMALLTARELAPIGQVRGLFILVTVLATAVMVAFLSAGRSAVPADVG